jgi:hypothetical protein
VTESEWRTCTDPDPMLAFLASRGPHDERRLRLVACACVRQTWHLLTPQARAAVEVAEAYAEGDATAADLARAQGRLEELEPFLPSPRSLADRAAQSASGRVVNSITSCLRSVRKALAAEGDEEEVKRAQGEVLRDVFGPMRFRTVAFDPRWRTPDVLTVAHSVHARRTFGDGDMPALADALEEAGCDCRELLDHLRGGGPHYLGCWGLDLVTGRG